MGGSLLLEGFVAEEKGGGKQRECSSRSWQMKDRMHAAKREVITRERLNLRSAPVNKLC
jgi:hypothetical protein